MDANIFVFFCQECQLLWVIFAELNIKIFTHLEFFKNNHLGLLLQKLQVSLGLTQLLLLDSRKIWMKTAKKFLNN